MRQRRFGWGQEDFRRLYRRDGVEIIEGARHIVVIVIMKDMGHYGALPWEVWIERDLRQDGSIYYVARHPECGPVSGPTGTGGTPEEDGRNCERHGGASSRCCCAR